MSRYTATPIREIGTVVTGKTPSTSEKHYYNGEYMFITPVELHDGYNVACSEKTLTEAGLKSISSNSICGTSVLVGCIGWDMGNVAMCHKKCATNQQINAITKFKPQYNPYYVYYWLSQKKEYLFSIASVTRTPILSKGTFEEVIIPIPSKDIQDSVVDVLKPFDERIVINKRICAELEAMAKTLYDYWFTQFDFPNADGKPYRSSGGEMVWNDQLKREIPKGWEVDIIGNILSKIPNTTRIQTSEYLSDGNIPVIDQSADYIAGYTNETDALLSSPTGYVVFGDHTRIVKYIRFPFARGADGTQILKSNTLRVPDELLYQIVQSVDLSNYGYARHFKFLKDTLTVIPDEMVAKKYVEIVTPIFDKQVQLTFENIELTKLRDWLLPMLMNGQATVE